jgi:hypothetical protein
VLLLALGPRKPLGGCEGVVREDVEERAAMEVEVDVEVRSGIYTLHSDRLLSLCLLPSWGGIV